MDQQNKDILPKINGESSIRGQVAPTTFNRGNSIKSLLKLDYF